MIAPIERHKIHDLILNDPVLWALFKDIQLTICKELGVSSAVGASLSLSIMNAILVLHYAPLQYTGLGSELDGVEREKFAPGNVMQREAAQQVTGSSNIPPSPPGKIIVPPSTPPVKPPLGAPFDEPLDGDRR